MNRSLLFRGVLVALVAVTAITGCRRRAQPGITPLAEGRGGAVVPSAGVTQPIGGAGTFGDGGVAGTGAGVGSAGLGNADGSVGLPGRRLDRAQYAENRGQFAGNPVYFDFDSALIRDSEKGKIAAVAAFLAGAPGASVEIEGHCDERGTEEYNLALGERRALAVREALVAGGIDPERIFTISFGESRPAVDGSDEYAWSRNRRGEFVVLTAR
jgi:peptidoglycan-associated lipoprotein